MNLIVNKPCGNSVRQGTYIRNGHSGNCPPICILTSNKFI